MSISSVQLTLPVIPAFSDHMSKSESTCKKLVKRRKRQLLTMPKNWKPSPCNKSLSVTTSCTNRTLRSNSQLNLNITSPVRTKMKNVSFANNDTKITILQEEPVICDKKQHDTPLSNLSCSSCSSPVNVTLTKKSNKPLKDILCKHCSSLIGEQSQKIFIKRKQKNTKNDHSKNGIKGQKPNFTKDDATKNEVEICPSELKSPIAEVGRNGSVKKKGRTTDATEDDENPSQTKTLKKSIIVEKILTPVIEDGINNDDQEENHGNNNLNNPMTAGADSSNTSSDTSTLQLNNFGR